jgi:hypothetical protein
MKNKDFIQLFCLNLPFNKNMTLNENQTRKQLIDSQITKASWNLFDHNEVRF